MSDHAFQNRAVPSHLRLPSYRLHKASGQAVVTLRGRDIYLGVFNSPESHEKYQATIAEFIAARGTMPQDRARITIAELILHYWRYAQECYSRETLNGSIKPALRRLRRMFSTAPVSEFGPLKLKAFRQALLDEAGEDGERLSRPYINRLVRQVRSLFKWGVGEELVPPSVYHGLLAVEGIRYGRCRAPEPAPVTPVADAVVEATLPHLSSVVADMVRLQRLTGMRPGEVCRMSTGEIDTSGAVWMYRPKHHKTVHHGKSRIVPIGPKGQEVLRNYLSTDLARPLFSPASANAEQRARAREANRTPFTPSRRRRDRARARRPRLRLNEAYTTTTYAQAIRRACDAAGVPVWTPNQLRHTKATELRKQFGLDAAGAVLGHSKLETTQIYAERSAELAAKVAMATG